MKIPNEPTSKPDAPQGRERRLAPREPFKVTVELLNMGDDPQVPFYQDLVTGESLDVSMGGLRVRVNYDVREGSDIGIILRKEDTFQAYLAHVVWKMRDGASTLYGLSVPRIDPAHVF